MEGRNSRQRRIPKNPCIKWDYYQQSSRTPKCTLQPHYWWVIQNGRVFLHIFWWFEGWCLEVNALGMFGDIFWCLVPLCILQYGLYIWVLLPRNRKEVHRVKLQVIRGSLLGNNFWPAVPCLSSGTLYLRCGIRHTPTQIVNFIKMVLSRDIWDSPWTGEKTQEFQDPTPSINNLLPPKQNSNYCTHATGVILELYDEASNPYGCGYQHSVMQRVLREKYPLTSIQPAEADFWWLLLRPNYGEGEVGLF